MATRSPALPKTCWEDQLEQLSQGLASQTRADLCQIRENYMLMYGKENIASFHWRTHMTNHKKDGASTNIFAVLSLWMLEPHERDAVVAREALRQAETNYKALIEIFTGQKSSHIFLMKQAYQTRFTQQLEQDIVMVGHPHPYQWMLVALAASHKAHCADVNGHIAKQDARRLYESREGGSGANEEALVLEILSKRSIPQLMLTFSSYKHIYGHDYTTSVEEKKSGEFLSALKTVVKCIYRSDKYYAKNSLVLPRGFQALEASIKGTVADEGTLVRIMVSRSESDMDAIQRVFKKKYGMELKDAICKSIPSGDYRDFLVALVRSETTATLHCV